MKIQTASLSYQRDLGSHITIREYSFFWHLMELAGDHIFPVVTFHLFCCNLPEWTGKIRWGKLDEDEYTDKCLFHYLYSFGQLLASGFGAYKHSREVGIVPVTVEWVHEHYPDADEIFSGGPVDAMNQRPGDDGDVTL
jgi:hypothetical protein